MSDERTTQEGSGQAFDPGNLQLEQDDLMIFGEDGNFYYVKKAQYMSPAQRLPEHFRGAPEFLVGLGAMVADISVFPSVQTNGSEQVQARKPEPLTGRCTCVLLNVAAIRQESEKKKRTPSPLKNGRQERVPPIGYDSRRAPEPKARDLVIFAEDGDFYLVEEALYKQQTLPRGMESAPLLMAELGTVAADIPRLPTAGSACHLVNLASIRMGTEKAAELIRRQKASTAQRVAPLISRMLPEQRVQPQARRAEAPREAQKRGLFRRRGRGG